MKRKSVIRNKSRKSAGKARRSVPRPDSRHKPRDPLVEMMNAGVTSPYRGGTRY